MNMDEKMEKICQLVQECGKLILGEGSGVEIKEKPGSANFVTAYDSLVQRSLVAGLKELFPDGEFVGEEDGCTDYLRTSEYAFFIDPIDGTTNFIHDFKMSALCVGMAKNSVLEFGVVYNPFRQEMFYAQRGKGAYLNGQPLHIEDKTLSEGMLCMDTAPYNPELREKTFAELQRLSYECQDIRSIGSAALSICYAACGRVVGYTSARLCVWDYAAASVILSEAGGKLVTEGGQDPDFRTYIPIIAGTKKSVERILEIKNIKAY